MVPTLQCSAKCRWRIRAAVSRSITIPSSGEVGDRACSSAHNADDQTLAQRFRLTRRHRRLAQPRLVRPRQSRKLASCGGRVISHFLARPFPGFLPLSLTVSPLPARVIEPAAQGGLLSPAGQGTARAPPRLAASRSAVDLPAVARRADAVEPTAPATAQQIQHQRRAESAHPPSPRSLGGHRGRRMGSYKVGSRDSHPGVRTESVPPVGSIPTGTFPTPRLPYQASGRASGADDDWISTRNPRLAVRFPRFLMSVH